MRLYEISTLNDRVTELPFLERNNLIRSNCSEFLNISNGRTLYRGFDNGRYLPEFFQSFPRPDRNSRGQHGELQTLYDKLLKKKGIAARRGNSILTTTNKQHASRFGNVYQIYPLNGFEWSTQSVTDFGSDQTTREFFYKLTDEVLDVNKISKLEMDSGVDFKWDYEKSISQNIQSYYYETGIWLPRSAVMDDEKLFKEIEKEFNPNNNDFNAALSSGKEILINGLFYATTHFSNY